MPYATQGRSTKRAPEPAPSPYGAVPTTADPWAAPTTVATAPKWADTSGYTGWNGTTSADYGGYWDNPAVITAGPNGGNVPGTGGGGATPQPDPFAWTTDFTTGVFNSPGYDEKWYQDHASEYDQPSASEQYWNAKSGAYGAGPERSTGAKAGYDQWFGQMGSQGLTEQGAAAGPRGTNYAGDAYGNRTLGGSRSGAFEDTGGPTFSSYGARAAASGAPNTTFDAGAAFDRYFDPLSAESNSEKLYGTDPGLENYYARASETGTEKIRNAMAARGLFGSGAALDEERQLAADLGADRAKNEASYRLQAAGQSDSERRARMGLAGELGAAADASSLGSSTNKRNWAGMLDDTELGQASERRAGREFADTEDRLRDRANLDWSSYLDDSSLNRSADERAWAQAGDDSRFKRSTEARNWTDLLGDETEQNNRSTLDFLDAGRAAAGASDASKLDRLAGGREGATAANNSLRQRYQDQFQNLLTVAQSKQGVINNAVDAATKQKLDTVMSTLKAKLAAVTNADNASQAQMDEIEGLIATATELTNAIKGK